MRPLPIVAFLFLACSGGGSELCSPNERCGDGVDNDCDGAIDEECACTPGDIQACGAGACAGEQQCEAGIWGTCYGGAATDEVCDGQDNDCDGVVDDGNGACGGVCELAGEPGAGCDGDDADACSEGTWTCDGTNQVACSDTTGSVFELCGDAADNNCDGRTDEYCAGAELRWIDHGGATTLGARAKAMGAAVGADGSIYVVGYHDRVTTFGAGAASWDAGNRTDGFIVKYAADGALVWHHPISGSGDETCDAIAIDPDGSLVIAGTFGGFPAPSTVQFAAGVVLTAEGGVDGYVARFTSAGGFVAVRQLGSDNDDEIGGVAVGPDGEVAVTGAFLGAGLHVGALTVPRSNNSWSFFAVTLDAGLVPAWTRRIELVAPASGPVRGTSVGFDAAGDLHVGGSVACYVECTAPALGVSRGEPDELAIASPGSGFVAKLAPAGALRWARAPAHVDAVAVLPGGAVYVAGAFAGTVVFGVGESTQTTLVSAGTTDGWIGRYGATGAFGWAHRFGSPGACFGGTPGDIARALAISAGAPVVTGSHNGALDFAGELTLSGDGWGNVFWAGYQADGVLDFAHNGKIGELPCSGGGDAAGIAVAPNGDMVVVGNFVTHLILPTETVVAPNEFFVAVFQP